MNITVYLGSNQGNDNKFKRAIEALGAFIGQRGDTLIFGGSKTGLMGILADSVIASGGTVVGVEPQMFIDKDFQHSAITDMNCLQRTDKRVFFLRVVFQKLRK